MNSIIIRNHINILISRWKSLLINHKLFFIAAIVGIIFMFPTLYGMYVANQHIIWQVSNIIILLGAISICLFGLFSKKHVIKIHHADVFYLFPDALKEKLIKIFIIPRSIIFLLVATAICNLLNEYATIIDVFLLFLIINGAMVQNLILYHSLPLRSNRLLLFMVNISIVPAYLYNQIQIVICAIFFVFNLLLMYKFAKTRLNREKLLQEMMMYDKIQHSARINDFGEMQVIQMEYSAIKKRVVTFLKNLSYENAIIQKIILNIRRIDFNVLLCMIIIYFISAIINLLYLKMDIIVMGFLAVVLINITEILSSKKELLYKKAKAGLFLPYSRKSITLAYVKVNLSLSVIPTIITVIVFESCIVISMLAFLCYSLFVFSSYYVGKNKAVKLVGNLIIVIISYVFVFI